MKSTHRPYNDGAANRWEDDVLKRFDGELRSADIHFLRGLRYMERRTSGFALPIVKNVRQWEKGAAMTDKTLKNSIQHCAALRVIDHEPGQPLLRGAASQVRRRTLEEIRTGVSDISLKSHTSTTAREVAARLRGRRFTYDGREICPTVTASRTGRVILSKPCTQVHDSHRRTQSILSGMDSDLWLIEADFKQAEPTVAREILRRADLAPAKWPRDIYQNLASYLGQNRDDVKRLVMQFMNAHSSGARAKAWAIRPGHFFHELAANLDAYKLDLWKRGKPRDGKRRHVYTLGRTCIEALKGGHTHKGQLFQWQNQGTVADIMNPAILELLDGEQTHGWRFIFPVHDSVYMATRNPSHEKDVADILRKHASSLGVRLRVKTSIRQGGERNGGGRVRHG